jgi:uncharacterized protein YndB with AHSA1/START domain
MTNAKKRTTLERSYEKATLDDVWALWTTKSGIESWWGPEGFSTTVDSIDLRVGGKLHYTMTATGPGQVEFMKKAGMPLSTAVSITYTQVVLNERLSFESLADFIPGTAPYNVGTTVELEARGSGVVMRVLLDVMHDQTWTERALAGWESQLGKLAKVLDR